MTDKPKLLVVDDSRTVRTALRNYLRGLFQIVEAEDGEAGWSLLASDPTIGLVVSDIFMPRLDGYGFICRIRSSEEETIRNKPVIVITSAEDDASRTRAYACGANDFILKPVEATEILARANTQLQASISGQTLVTDDMLQYASVIEAAVLEKPNLAKAVELLKAGEAGAVDPYLIDLCLEALPLFERANQAGQLTLERELSAIKARLGT